MHFSLGCPKNLHLPFRAAARKFWKKQKHLSARMRRETRSRTSISSSFHLNLKAPGKGFTLEFLLSKQPVHPNKPAPPIKQPTSKDRVWAAMASKPLTLETLACYPRQGLNIPCGLEEGSPHPSFNQPWGW